MWTISTRAFFFPPLHLNVKQLLDVMAGWHATIASYFLSSLQCDWINYVSLTLLEVSKHTFLVTSHQSMWPWRWKVKHVSQEAGQRGIRPLISGPTQSHHSRLLPWELKLSLWAMYSEFQFLDFWCMLTFKQPKDGYQIQKHLWIALFSLNIHTKPLEPDGELPEEPLFPCISGSTCTSRNRLLKATHFWRRWTKVSNSYE